MSAYYNENDPAAAHVLRHMISAGVIAPGVVDDRSIKEVSPDDIKGFAQVHLFAGGGLWSVAARLAGWPDDAPLWTASCPCQPFSAAGKGSGTDDPRHLWPDVHRLARAVRPSVLMGEQVAGKAGYGWFDGVRADLARENYTSRSVDFPACAVNAPHQRNRLYWVAMDNRLVTGLEGQSRHGDGSGRAVQGRSDSTADGGKLTLEHGSSVGRREGRAERHVRGGRSTAPGTDLFERCISPDAALPIIQGQSPAGHEPDYRTDASIHADADALRELQPKRLIRDERGRDLYGHDQGNYWQNAEWIECHDGKARRTKPGICNVAHGVSGEMDNHGCESYGDLQETSQKPHYGFLVKSMIGRVDLWRIAGNAIVPEAAKEVIAAFIDVYGPPSCRGA